MRRNVAPVQESQSSLFVRRSILTSSSSSNAKRTPKDTLVPRVTGTQTSQSMGLFCTPLISRRNLTYWLSVQAGKTNRACASRTIFISTAIRRPPTFRQREIVSYEDYYKEFIHSDAKFRQDYGALLDYSRTLNSQLQAKKITEADRGFLISGVLIALHNDAFIKSYRSHRTAKQLATNLLETIQAEFEAASLPQDRADDLAQAFSFISHSPSLVKDKEYFIQLISGIDDNINTFMRTHEYDDTIGQFYVEFLRYANNDKGLGIVLTPRPDIADLFTELAEVNRDSVVFDNCCGTAGLLISAMEAMIRDAGPDGNRSRRGSENQQLFGVGYQTKIYALAVSNMILHGDGKTNIFRGDLLQDATRLIAPHKPTVGLLNPPYENKTVKEDREELEFILGNLECLEQGGKCVAIVPITPARRHLQARSPN